MLKTNRKATCLAKKSGLVMSVFTRTLNALKRVNEQVESQLDKERCTVTNANAHIAELNQVKESNSKTIQKISKFLA